MEFNTEFKPKPLPCYPCPHLSACCQYGTSLTEDEAATLAKEHGQDKVYKTRWGEWRTRVKNKRCVFVKDNACVLHAKPYYPVVCRGFPWFADDLQSPYPYEMEICPDLRGTNELVEAHKLWKTRKKRIRDMQKASSQS